MKMKPFDYELKDPLTPYEYIIQEIVPVITDSTNGHLFAKLEEYTGNIYSHEIKTGGGLSAIGKLYEEKTVFHDIQSDLGELKRKNFTYEFYLGSSTLHSYKYRLLFLRYGSAGYPANIVLAQSISDEINKSGQYIYKIKNLDELKKFWGRVLESTTLHDVMQEAIISSIREKEREVEEEDFQG